jgi:ribonuclease HI
MGAFTGQPIASKTGAMKIFFDGGCRPNPGRMEAAAVAAGKIHYAGDLGLGSSHKAEWLALFHALEVARASGASTIVLLGDSAALINQVNSRSKPRDAEISALVVRFQEEALHFQRLRVRHVRRTQNLAGIALAKLREVARDAELRHRV